MRSGRWQMRRGCSSYTIWRTAANCRFGNWSSAWDSANLLFRNTSPNCARSGSLSRERRLRLSSIASPIQELPDCFRVSVCFSTSKIRRKPFALPKHPDGLRARSDRRMRHARTSIHHDPSYERHARAPQSDLRVPGKCHRANRRSRSESTVIWAPRLDRRCGAFGRRDKGSPAAGRARSCSPAGWRRHFRR